MVFPVTKFAMWFVSKSTVAGPAVCVTKASICERSEKSRPWLWTAIFLVPIKELLFKVLADSFQSLHNCVRLSCKLLTQPQYSTPSWNRGISGRKQTLFSGRKDFNRTREISLSVPLTSRLKWCGSRLRTSKGALVKAAVATCVQESRFLGNLATFSTWLAGEGSI